MHIHVDTALVLIALASSIVLLLQSGERAVALVALFASGLEALIAFGWISLTVASVRIELGLPVVLAVAGALAWLRASGKHAITAGTLVAAVGGVQLLIASHLLSHA